MLRRFGPSSVVSEELDPLGGYRARFTKAVPMGLGKQGAADRSYSPKIFTPHGVSFTASSWVVRRHHSSTAL